MFKVIKLKKVVFWLIIIVILLNVKNITRLFFPNHYSDIIYKYSEEYSLDPYLICGIIKAESNFNTYAVSNKDARGAMQITKDTAEWIAEKLGDSGLSKELYIPEVNIRMGCYYMDYLIKMYDGNIKNALCAYNAGFNTVNRWLGDSKYSADGKTLSKIPYRETELYVTKVLNNQRIYSILYKTE